MSNLPENEVKGSAKEKLQVSNSEHTRFQWLFDEYRLASQHYFHEDNYYVTNSAMFLILEGILAAGYFAIHKENPPNNGTITSIVISSFGFIVALIWQLRVLRISWLQSKTKELLTDLSDFLNGKDICQERKSLFFSDNEGVDCMRPSELSRIRYPHIEIYKNTDVPLRARIWFATYIMNLLPLITAIGWIFVVVSDRV